jgi:hypothetical protein
MLPALDRVDCVRSVVTVIIRRSRVAPQYVNKLLLKELAGACSRWSQLQIVTYTGGRNREGGTPPVGDLIRCMASGVVR